MGAPAGNQNATKAKEWEQSLKRAMARKASGDFRKTLDDIAERVVDAALAGERDAWREIGDRIDGKATQAIDANVSGSLTTIIESLPLASPRTVPAVD